MAVVIDHQCELLLGYQEDKILLQGDIFIQLLIHITVDAKSTLMLSSMEIKKIPVSERLQSSLVLLHRKARQS